MASWLECSTRDRVVRVRVLRLGTLCCVLGQDTLLSRLLSPPKVYKWVPAKCWCQPYDGLASHPGGSTGRNTPSRFMLMKLEISTGLMGLLARKQRLLGLISTVMYMYTVAIMARRLFN